ncbi:MAG: MarR family transcriptional regulator [Desulfobacteraceae bacterium]|nr:MarR family transcriptional regulator [Desulfobacteraceae bacterium]
MSKKHIDSYLSNCYHAVMIDREQNKRTQTGEAFTKLILETFRFNGQLIAAGDKLTKELGLTSALWQVLGAIRETPISIAQIARNMGLTRQSVRRSANVLMDKGFVRFDENPDHKRAKLVVPTKAGRKVLDQIKKIQVDWSNKVSDGLSVANLKTLIQTMKTLSERL